MKRGMNVLMPHAEKKARANSNIREISFDIWKGTKATSTNVPRADLYGRQEKIDMSMNGLFTGR